MPKTPTAPVDPTLLNPQLLAGARADPRRKWAARALCAGVDPDVFFPAADGPIGPAQTVCGRCPVCGQCLAYAVIADEPFGIWGGLGPRERQALRRQLQRRGELPPLDSGSVA
jgi:WhiB family redox-sensing transcriptional regulator